MKELFGVLVILFFGVFLKSDKRVLSSETIIEPTPTSIPVTIAPSRFPTTVPVTHTSSEWQYPGSNKTGDKYESRDDANKITDWYVVKIKSMGLPVTSFVKTSANGKIKNSLGAAKNNWKIKIEISQNSSSELVTIIVSIDN